MRYHCTTHCSTKGGCGQHFRGMNAFDAHLKRIAEGVNERGTRTYELQHLSGPDAKLEPIEGDCAFGELEGITIWRIPLSEQARDFFKRMEGEQK